MCGFVTVFSKKKSDSSALKDSLSKAVLTLKHRGPDAQKVWVSDQGQIGMAHARLSIIDLNTGDQPLSTQDNQIHAVVNGELYDYETIRRDLISRGHHFKTKSDSEILLHLYQEKGTSCLKQLRGEFAFTLWDQSNATLFAARDRFGIKPLYYSIVDEKVYFASEVKALFAAGVPAKWDEESIMQFHRGVLFSPGRTLYHGVYQVPPGHYVLASKGSFQIHRYWDFNYPESQNTLPKKSEQEYVEELRNIFYESVRLRLRADVPVACYLSGGLDSCAVLGAAAIQLKHPIRAFTISFDQVEYDEEIIAREMASHSGAEYTPIQVNAAQLADHFSEALWHAEVPFANTHGIAKFLLSKAVRDAGYKVVLTGEGSDEVFAGYPHFRRDLMLYSPTWKQTQDVQSLLSELQKKNQVSQGLLLPQESKREIASLKQTLGFIPSFMETFAGLGDKMGGILQEPILAKYAQRDVHRAFLNEIDVPAQLTERDPVHQAMYLWSKTFLPNYILSVLGDRMEMGHSVEGRVPFLDHHLVECAVKIPVEYKIKNLTEKYVLREAARPVLTKTVYERQKHPFLAPPVASQLDGSLFQLMQDTLRSKALSDVPFYDSRAILKLLDQVPSLDSATRSAMDPLLMSVLSICLLQEKFGLNSD